MLKRASLVRTPYGLWGKVFSSVEFGQRLIIGNSFVCRHARIYAVETGLKLATHTLS